jgi:hypothetical protein
VAEPQATPQVCGPRVRFGHGPPQHSARHSRAGPPSTPSLRSVARGTNKVSPPRSEATLGGAGSPPGEARGAVPRSRDHEFAPLTAPLDPATPGRSPPNSLAPLGRAGDKQVSPPRSEATLGGAAPPGEARGAVPRSRRPGYAGPVPPKLPRSARSRGGQTRSLPPGAKRHWGEQPRHQARQGGPSREAVITSSLRSPPPSTRLRRAGPPQTPSLRSVARGTNKVSPPRSEATLGGAASPPGEARGAVPRSRDHEFASLTAPLDPAQPGRSPQHSLAPLGREGDKRPRAPLPNRWPASPSSDRAARSGASRPAGGRG